MDELVAYKELVDKVAQENSKDILPNAGKDHAAIVMAKMFEKTESSVNMIVGSLDGKVSDQEIYLEKLRICVEKRISINIIFGESPNLLSSAYKLLDAKRNENYPITFSQAQKDSLVKQTNGETAHFAVFDNNKFRFEKDTKKYLAWFCFNDKSTAQRLLQIFNGILAKADTI